MDKLKSEKLGLSKKMLIGYLVLLIVLGVGSYELALAEVNVTNQVRAAKELSRPADISVARIVAPQCELCEDAGSIISELESTGSIKITEDKKYSLDSDQAKLLVEKYGIERIPAIVFSGEIEKENAKKEMSSVAEFVEDAALWQAKNPVFVDALTKEERGAVSVVLLDDQLCTDCYDPNSHTQILKNNFGMAVVDEKTFDISSEEAQDLISTYKITSVPTVLISGDVELYSRFIKAWAAVGTKEEDGTFVFRDVSALGSVVYKDLLSGAIMNLKEE